MGSWTTFAACSSCKPCAAPRGVARASPHRHGDTTHRDCWCCFSYDKLGNGNHILDEREVKQLFLDLNAHAREILPEEKLRPLQDEDVESLFEILDADNRCVSAAGQRVAGYPTY